MGYRFASASLQGETKNPWDPTCWTCGSSSGSGAIVAAGLAAFAIGTETWGSIICPSAFCGVSGLRPTYGRVSRYGAMALSPSMENDGAPTFRANGKCPQALAATIAPSRMMIAVSSTWGPRVLVSPCKDADAKPNIHSAGQFDHRGLAIIHGANAIQMLE